MDINFSYGQETVHNLAYIKALFIKYNIESLNISYAKKEILRKQVLKELEELIKAEENRSIAYEGFYEKQN